MLKTASLLGLEARRAENVSKLCAFLCWLSWQTSMSVILVGVCQKIDIDSDGIPHLLLLLWPSPFDKT